MIRSNFIVIYTVFDEHFYQFPSTLYVLVFVMSVTLDQRLFTPVTINIVTTTE